MIVHRSLLRKKPLRMRRGGFARAASAGLLASLVFLAGCAESSVELTEPTGQLLIAETYDFGANPTGWALCVSALGPEGSVKMFVFYGTPDVAAFAVNGWAFGAEVGDVDVVGSAVVVETVPLPAMDPGVTVEVEAIVSLLELSAESGGVIEDRSGTGTTQIQIENVSDRETCQESPEELRLEVEMDIEMSDSSTLRLVFDGKTQSDWP